MHQRQGVKGTNEPGQGGDRHKQTRGRDREHKYLHGKFCCACGATESQRATRQAVRATGHVLKQQSISSRMRSADEAPAASLTRLTAAHTAVVGLTICEPDWLAGWLGGWVGGLWHSPSTH